MIIKIVIIVIIIKTIMNKLKEGKQASEDKRKTT